MIWSLFRGLARNSLHCFFFCRKDDTKKSFWNYLTLSHAWNWFTLEIFYAGREVLKTLVTLHGTLEARNIRNISSGQSLHCTSTYRPNVPTYKATALQQYWQLDTWFPVSCEVLPAKHDHYLIHILFLYLALRKHQYLQFRWFRIF